MRTIIIVLLPILALSSSQQSDWQPLFDNDLSNALDEKGVWYNKGDVLTASEDACIFTTLEYENFVIDLEFKNEKGTNSGVIVYCTNRQDWIPNSVEVQIADDFYFMEEDWELNFMCGGVFGHLPPTSTLVKKVGEWNHMNIRCEGQQITIKLNGVVSAEMDMTQWTSGTINPDGSEIPSWLPTPFAELPTKGYIGLQGKHGEANIYFRNVKIGEL